MFYLAVLVGGFNGSRSDLGLMVDGEIEFVDKHCCAIAIVQVCSSISQ